MIKGGDIELKGQLAQGHYVMPEALDSETTISYETAPIKPLSNEKNIVLKKLLKVVTLAGAFMALEVLGGLWADSIAILSDAAHMLSDVLGFVISITSVWVSTFPANSANSFGFHRA